MAKFNVKPLIKAIGRVGSETNLKEAEAKVASRVAGEETLDPKQQLPTEEELNLPNQADNPNVAQEGVPATNKPSEGQEALTRDAENLGDRTELPELEPPVEKPAMIDESPLNQEELEALLDASSKPLEGDPQYTNMNLKRISTLEDIGSTADEMIRITMERGKGIGDRTTHAKVEKDAKAVAWGTITNKQREGIPLDIEELTAAREVEARLMSDIKRRADELKDHAAEGTDTVQMKVQFMEDAAKVMAISRFIRGESRRAGQILNAHKIVVNEGSAISGKQRNEFLEVPNVEQNYGKMLDSILASNNTDEMLDALDTRGFRQRWGSRAGNAWYNVVLSKFALGKAFTGGFVLGKMVMPVERMVSSAIMKMRPSMAKNQPAWNAQVQMGEVLIETFGWLTAMKDAWGPLVRHLQDPTYDLGKAKLQRPGMDVRDTIYSHIDPDASATKRYTAQAVDALTQNGSMRLMKLNDWIVRQSIGMSRAKALAYRTAVNEGLEGKALSKRVEELVDQMPDEMYDDMIQSGDTATLTQVLSQPSKKFLSWINSVPIFRFVMPFMKTALAGLELGLERLPGVAHRMPRVKGAWEKGGAARADLISKQVVGTSVIGLGVAAYTTGDATSGATMSKNERMWRQTLGWKPFSISDGKGGYSSWNFLSPVHELFMVGVSLAEFLDYANEGIPPTDPRYKTWEEVGMDLGQVAVWSFTDIYLNKSVGRSVREMMGALEEPSTKGKRKTLNMMTPLLVPIAGMDHLVGAVDDVYRRVPAGTFFEQMQGELQKRIPWYSKEMLPQIGYFGEERHKNGGFLLGMLGYREGDPNTEVAYELFANNVPVRRPNRHLTVAGMRIDLDVDLSPAMISEADIEAEPDLAKRGYAYYRYSKIRGDIYKEYLNQFVKSEQYQNSDLPYGPPGDESIETTRGDLLQSFIMQLNTMARIQFEAEFKDKMDIFNVIGQLRVERSESGTKSFVPPGIEKQMLNLRHDEHADMERRQEIAEGIQTEGVKW